MKLKFNITNHTARLSLFNSRFSFLGLLASLITCIMWIVLSVKTSKKLSSGLNPKALLIWSLILGFIIIGIGIWLIISSKKMEKNNSNGFIFGCGVSGILASIVLIVVSIICLPKDEIEVLYMATLAAITGFIAIVLFVPFWLGLTKVSQNI